MLIDGLKLAGVAMSGVASAVAAANDAVDGMIDTLKTNENPTINRIGRVLEGTKFGFMLGYLTPSILTAVGVALTTGDLMAAVGGGVAVLGNPVAGVCAAVGAVYFGWKALNDQERSAILESVGQFLKVGYEMIKAVVQFALNLMKDLLSADNLEELKQTVSEAAEVVGRHLADITHSVKDKAAKTADSLKKTASNVSEAMSSAFKKKGKGTDSAD